jgi:CHASE2 domain-containing sensor protein
VILASALTLAVLAIVMTKSVPRHATAPLHLYVGYAVIGWFGICAGSLLTIWMRGM